MRLKGAAVPQADEGLAHHVDQCRRLWLGQRMAGRHDQHQRIGAEIKRLQPLDIGRIRHHAHIGQAGAQGIDDVVARPLFQIDRDARMRREERTQRLRQVLRQRRAVAQQPHMALDAGAVVTQFALQLVDLPQHQLRVARQGAAGRRQLNATPRTRQQRRAERILHAANALAGRSQRHVAGRRAAGDGAGFLHVQKQAQVGEVEMRRPVFRRCESGMA